MGYAIRITSRAVDVVSGADQTQGTIAAEATGVRPGGLRSKFSGAQIHSRKSSLGRVVRQGNGWVVENHAGGGGGSAVGSPMSAAGFTPPSRPSSMYAPSPYSPYTPSTSGFVPGSVPGSPAITPAGVGLGFHTPAYGAAGPPSAASSPYTPGSGTLPPPPPPPRTPSLGYAHFPPTPNPATGNGVGFIVPPPPPPPGRRSNENGGGGKKDD